MTTLAVTHQSETPQGTSPLAVFRNRNFSLLWIAQFISTMGTGLMTLAASMLVFRQTGTAASVGMVLIASFLPSLLFGIVAGALADRYDRKRLMIAAEVVRGLLTLAIPLLLPYGVIWLYLLLAASNTVKQFFDPAQASLIPEVIEQKQLASANAMLTISVTGAEMFGLMVAGLMVAGDHLLWAFYLDAISFLLSALSLLLLRLPQSTPYLHKNPAGNAADKPSAFVREGMRYICATPVLRYLLILFAPMFIIFGVIVSVNLPFIMHTVATESFSTEFFFGLLEGGGLIGFVLGSYLFALWRGRLRDGQWMTLSLIGMSLSIILFAQATAPLWLWGFNFLYAFLNSFSYITRQLLLQQATPAGLLGRVSGVFFVTRDTCYVAGMSLAVLGDYFPLDAVITVCGLLLLLCGLITWAIARVGR